MILNRYRNRANYRNNGSYRYLFRQGLIVRGIAKPSWLTQKLKARTALLTRTP